MDAKTPDPERRRIFAPFRAEGIQVLCNCNLASYRFDLPELSCVVLARPTKSLVLFLQMIGRGLRPAPGKQDCLILDHAGNVHRHGFATAQRCWTLDGDWALAGPGAKDGRPEPTELRTITCADCSAVFSGSRVCPECGWSPKPQGRPVETIDGELVEIGAGLPADEADQMRFFAELLGERELRGRQPGWAAHRFRDKFGRFPPWAWQQLPPAVPSVVIRRWLQSRNIAWRKRGGRS